MDRAERFYHGNHFPVRSCEPRRSFMNGALVGIVAAALLALGLGFLARRGRQMGLGQWTVAGRSFGAPLVFLLMAGKIYTTFAFLGGSGFAYGRGGYILCYATLAYVMSYFMLPPI